MFYFSTIIGLSLISYIFSWIFDYFCFNKLFGKFEIGSDKLQ